MPIPVEKLRWRCPPELLAFNSTSEVEPVAGVIGQDAAVEALRFGLEINAPGQNIFVRGLSGTGRLTLVRRLLREIRPSCPFTMDRCFVHNFVQPDRPALITLPAGEGQVFRRRIDKLAEFVRHDLSKMLSSDQLKAQRNLFETQAKQELEKLVEPFKQALQTAGLTMVSYQAGPVVQTAIFPVVDGKPVQPDEFEQLKAAGTVTEEQYSAFKKNTARFEQQLEEVNEQAGEINRRLMESIQEISEKAVRWILGQIVRKIDERFPQPSVKGFLSDLVDDLVKHRLGDEEQQQPDFTRLYRVNVLLEHKPEAECPIVAESAPNVRSLLGSLEYDFSDGEAPQASHMGIRAGSLLRADGGFLVLDVHDLLSEPEAWKVLVRTLRTGQVEIVPSDRPYSLPGPSLKPEPVPITVKVVLIGDAQSYHLLDAHDNDFNQLFKVLADFGTEIPRDPQGVQQYAQVISRIASDEQLLPFDKSAVAVILEQGARIAARGGKLSTRFGRIADIAREAAFAANKKQHPRVADDDVREAIDAGRRRADLPSRRFRELIADGTLKVDSTGRAVGQINGLAVLQAGPLTYGFPARITATIGPGTAGVINIEREAALSGAIHTKGFYILGGLMRTLLQTDHPLAFDASVAFEQSYGGIDGDSASGAEICCLLSALTNIALRQDLAMTGAIDQMGHILAIGAVNEKIEGFFDICNDSGLTGMQGVIIPRSNAGDLMLREDVVKACAANRFQIYAVATVKEALEIFTGLPAGCRDDVGCYPRDSLLGIAVHRAHEFWLKASQPPPQASATRS